MFSTTPSGLQIKITWCKVVELLPPHGSILDPGVNCNFPSTGSQQTRLALPQYQREQLLTRLPMLFLSCFHNLTRPYYEALNKFKTYPISSVLSLASD